MAKLRKVIRRNKLPEYVGLKKTQIDALVRNDPSFPKGFKPTEGGHATVYFEDEIAAWQERRAGRAAVAD